METDFVAPILHPGATVPGLNGLAPCLQMLFLVKSTAQTCLYASYDHSLQPGLCDISSRDLSKISGGAPAPGAPVLPTPLYSTT